MGNRSANLGLELIKNLDQMETRPSLACHLSSKYENIMKQFLAEVGMVEHEFLVRKWKVGWKKMLPTGNLLSFLCLSTAAKPVFRGWDFWRRHCFRVLYWKFSVRRFTLRIIMLFQVEYIFCAAGGAGKLPVLTH